MSLRCCNNILHNIILKRYLSISTMNEILKRTNSNEEEKDLENLRLPKELGAVHCPYCFNTIIKGEGCSTMMCTGCGKIFDHSSAKLVRTVEELEDVEENDNKKIKVNHSAVDVLNSNTTIQEHHLLVMYLYLLYH